MSHHNPNQERRSAHNMHLPQRTKRNRGNRHLIRAEPNLQHARCLQRARLPDWLHLGNEFLGSSTFNCGWWRDYRFQPPHQSYVRSQLERRLPRSTYQTCELDEENKKLASDLTKADSCSFRFSRGSLGSFVKLSLYGNIRKPDSFGPKFARSRSLFVLRRKRHRRHS